MESRIISSCVLHRHGNLRSEEPKVTKPRDPNNTPRSKSPYFDGHDSWQDQVDRMNSGPRRSLKMDRIMECNFALREEDKSRTPSSFDGIKGTSMKVIR